MCGNIFDVKEAIAGFSEDLVCPKCGRTSGFLFLTDDGVALNDEESNDA